MWLEEIGAKALTAAVEGEHHYLSQHILDENIADNIAC